MGELLAASHHERREADRPHLPAPVDLQVIEAARVTFAASLIECSAWIRRISLDRAWSRMARAESGRIRGG